MYALRPIQLLVQIHFADDGFDQTLLVVRIEDDEILCDRQVFRLAPQDSRADRVEGAEHHAFGRLLVQNGFDAFVHFPGGFVGKGDGEDLPWADAFVGDQIGDALGQHPRLPGPGTCDDQNRSIRRCDRAALLWVEFVDEIQIHGGDIIKRKARTVVLAVSFVMLGKPCITKMAK